MPLPTFTRKSNTSQISEALKAEGAAIVSKLADESLVEAVVSQLRPVFDSRGRQFENDFNGYSTLRLADVLAHSPAAADLIADDTITDIIDPVLLPFCLSYRIGSTTGIDIHPGEGSQTLHTDGSIYPMRVPGVEWQVSVMWALDDFTEENGATRVIPRSHRQMNPDPVDGAMAEQAIMPKGSALLYLGSVVHGGGENRSSRPRMGLVNTYALGWLRQEVNQYLTLKRETVMRYPEKLRRLMGYQCHGPYLGRFEGDPDDYWYNKHKERSHKH